jgi:hypothetical protein
MRPTLCAIAVVASVIGAQAATAEDYVDRTFQYRLTVPEGWKQVKGVSENNEAAIFGLISPRFDSTTGMCLIASVGMNGTANISQEALNEGMTNEIDEAFWRSTLEDKTVKDLTIVETKTEMKSGRRGFYAIARLTSTDEGKDRSEQQWHVLFVVPGRIHLGQCSVDVAQISTEEADIKAVIASFEPTGSGGVISSLEPRDAQAPQTAQLVLHGGPQFNGPSHTLTQDMPNLPAAGWSAVTASFNLRGYGLWQICDGINYRGNCRVVAGAESAALGDRALRIGSARRVVDPRDPRTTLGVVSDKIAEMLKIDRRQFNRKRLR